jgi:subfamily B ATP-binding cassette protein MsbA
MKSLKRVLLYALPYKGFAILNAVSNVFYAVFSLLSIVILMPVLGILFDSQEKIINKPVYTGISGIGDYLSDSLNYLVTQQIISNGEVYALAVVSIIGAALFLFKNLFRYAALYFLAFLRSGVSKDLRNELHRKVIDLPISFYSEKRKGDIIARMTSDVNDVQWSYLSSLEMIVREPVMIISTLLAMVYMSPKLTIFIFILLPISGGIISAVGNSLKRKSVKAQNTNAHILSLIEEHISGLRVIKAFTAENKITKLFHKSTDEYFNHTVSVNHRKDLASPISEFLGSVVIFLIVWFGGSMVFEGGEGALLPQEFMAFIGLFYNILNPAKALTTAFYNMKKGEASADRIFQVLDQENKIIDKIDAIDSFDFDREIELQNVKFKYEDKLVINDFNLKIKKGQTIALVGQSGSGKTTIANLIPRFYDVSEGSIQIDGIDIRDLKKQSLRSLIGIVTQESILFNDSVKGNLTLGVDNKSDEEIVNAAKVANAHEFISQLSYGYDTNIGDGGNKLSGGQKQRLSIARAVLSNPSILILDEATSALDTESEQLVQEALNKLMKNRTSIVIAHRLSTIQNADSIVVMNEGKIVEQGTHQDLIDKDGAYNKLIQMQSFE